MSDDETDRRDPAVPAPPDPRAAIALTDPVALRAYAHPLRMRLVGLLRREGPLTASRAAALLGESSGATSFHLRQLAKYGVVEEAGGGTGRERPWRATAMFTHVPGVADSPELAEASAQFRALVAARHHELMLDWIYRAADEPADWQDATPFSDYLLYVTAAELDELGQAVDALLMQYAGRVADPTTRPEGARLVTYLNWAAPSRPEPGEPAAPPPQDER